MIHIAQDEYQRIQQVLPILCVDVVVIYQAKCLLLRRLNHPAKGQWWFPGGRILKEETIRDAAIRKTKEETGLDANYLGILSVEETIFPRLENMVCVAHTVNVCCHLVPHDISTLTIDCDHDSYQWVGIECMNSLNLHDAVLNPLKLVLSRKNFVSLT